MIKEGVESRLWIGDVVKDVFDDMYTGNSSVEDVKNLKSAFFSESTVNGYIGGCLSETR